MRSHTILLGSLVLCCDLWAYQTARLHPCLKTATEYVERGDVPKAIQVLQNIIEVRPECGSEVYVRLAELQLTLNETDKALAVLDRGTRAYPESVELLKRFGQILLNKNPIDPRAGDALKQAANAAVNDAEAHYFYGQWACLNHLDELCVSELSKAAVLPGSNDQAKMQIFTLIGLAEVNRNRATQGEEAFRKALSYNLRLKSPSPDAALEYARFLANESRDSEAQRLIDRILQFAPQFGPAHLERGKWLDRQGELARAAAEAELALEYAGNDKSQLRAAHVFLAKTYNALGQEEQAKIHQRWIQSQ